MTLTTYPNEAPLPERVRVRILAHTVCEVGDVFKDEVVEVTALDAHRLKAAGKAELVPVEVPVEAEEPVVEFDEAELRAALDKKTKEEIVAGAKENLALDLTASKTKAELIDAVVAAWKAQA
jgi:hypothetical protein